VKFSHASTGAGPVETCRISPSSQKRLRIRSHLDTEKFQVASRFAVGALVLLMAICNSALSAQTRSAATHAQSVGVPLTTIIIFGDQYNGGDELYDVRITVKEVVRGEKAWQLVRDASASNKQPAPGLEYLLARVHFEFSARTRPEHYSYTLDAAQFTAMSGDDKLHDPAALAKQPEPSLHATLRSGDSAEGWVAFLVPRGDHTPLMLFREDVGNLSHEGNGSIFKLYYENTSASAKPKPS
jgi:hypothetical protein